jgi:hypothetical protein
MKKKTPVRFVVCVENDGYPEALELRKLYRVLPDAKAAKVNFVRIIDESGEDYLYPKTLFAPVKLTSPVCGVCFLQPDGSNLERESLRNFSSCQNQKS